ncbi:MAG TPA: LacI family DNA-binding transcriptional regulator [Candidatus Angelobacter sp.]|jgi:LacI family transcriptional regulator|nr:LacI family DNA-binding transcriptional regulator [Candidatus Angelobacter sp.]
MRKSKEAPNTHKPVGLKDLSRYLGLSTATISTVLNGTPAAAEIPAATQERILAAAEKFNYRPNALARSLRGMRSHTVGVLVPEISEGYGALVLAAVGDYLLSKGYFFFVATHRRKPELLEEYPQMLRQRSVEGFIVIDTALEKPLPLPTVVISGHRNHEGITNIVLNHDRAAHLALEHLVQLGHERIAFIQGQPFSADSETRWKAIERAAESLGLEIQEELIVQLEIDTFSPYVGYPVVRRLLQRTRDFTALFAYNDLSAIGALRALRDSGLRVPEDVSVVGFDDINSAAFQIPSLTTVRQPLDKMGALAGEILLQRIQGGENPVEVMVDPELIVRESTAPARPRVEVGAKLESGVAIG